MTLRFNGETGELFPDTPQGRAAALHQAVADRVLTILGDRPGHPNYGSYALLRGALPGVIEESIINTLRDLRPEVTSVQGQQTGRELDIWVNGISLGTIVEGELVTEMAFYSAMVATLRSIADLNYNLIDRLDWDQAPIEYVRSWARGLQLPVHTELLGEQFEREVLKNWRRFMTEYDSPGILDLYASLAGMTYTLRVDSTGKATYCFTPPARRSQGLDAPYKEELEVVVPWLQPIYRANYEILVCTNAEDTVNFVQYATHITKKVITA